MSVASRRARAGLRPGLILAASLLLAPAWAGPGHDHGDAEPAARPAGAPQRLADGRVLLPKPAQRSLQIRTRPLFSAVHARSVELAAQVVAEPGATGWVQALNAGRLEPGPRGLPGPGQAVRRGELLAQVQTSLGPLERAAQAGQIAELEGTRRLAEARLARLRELADTVPRRELEALELELQGLAARLAAQRGGLQAREALRAPIDGVISSAAVASGQAVAAGERIFEIIDPRRLRIEALSFDPALAAQVAGARLQLGDRVLPLRYLGAVPQLREQAQPLHFQLEGEAAAPLARGQLLKIQVQTREAAPGLAVPASARVRNPANQDIVWVKTAPETFEPRLVRLEPLDGASLRVLQGLEAGDRVVVQGATLLNQIR